MFLRAAIVAAWLLTQQSWAAVFTNDIAAEFYNPNAIQTVELEIEEVDLQRLNRALPKRIVVPAVFKWKNHLVRNVAVRYKGNSSSDPKSPHKRGLLIDFGEFEKGQRFMGLRHVSLDNGIQFGSLFSERLITDILHGLGVNTSRCNYARVSVNQRFMGVFVNVERIDKVFLEGRFGDDGVLFKIDEGGPGADLRFVGENPGNYRQAFELRSGREREAFDHLVDFIRLINRSTLTEATLRENFDVDSFIKTTAVMLLAGAFDQYTGWNAHNYYLYREPKTGRWHYLAWDLDVGFADHAFDKIPVIDGWDAAWPVPVPGRPLMERIVSNENLLRAYRSEAKVILEKSFHPDVIVPKLRALHAQVRSDLEKDPFPARRATNPGDKNYDQIVADMEAFIRKRYESARSQLAFPGPRPISKMETTADNGPRPGQPSTSDPSALRVGKLTPNSVELVWRDNAQGEVAHVVQRASRSDSDFVNAIGQHGAAITNAIDSAVEPGKSYRYRVYAVFPSPQGPRGSGVSNVVTVDVPEK